MPARPRKAASPNARKVEALGAGIEVAFGGHTYTIPPYREWDLDVLDAIDEQRFVAAVVGVIGKDQWAEFRSHHSKVGEFEDFLGIVMEGSGQGNS